MHWRKHDHSREIERLAESIELMRAENEKTAQNVRILATVADQTRTRAAQMMEAIASLG